MRASSVILFVIVSACLLIALLAVYSIVVSGQKSDDAMAAFQRCKAVGGVALLSPNGPTRVCVKKEATVEGFK